MVKIRRAEPEDRGSLQYVAKQAYALYRERMDRDPAPMHADFAAHIRQDTVFVAQADKANGDICGYAVLVAHPSGWLLDNIAVDPVYKGNGIGTRLLACCESYLIDLNVAKYRLYTNVMMHESFAWYLSLGFTETDRRMEDGFHRIYMERHLKDRESKNG